MSLIRDALAYLVGLGKDSTEVNLVNLPGGKVLVCDRGENRELSIDPNCKRDQLHTLQDLVQWITAYGSEDREPDVFVNEQRVAVYCERDAKHKMESAAVALVTSQAWKTLLSWIERPRLQRDVVRALRGPLAGSVSDKVLDVFKRLDFSRLAKSTIEHDSLGKSVEAKAQSSAGEIPESIIFALPVYDLPEVTSVQLRCAVEVDSDTQTIGLIPVRDGVADAIRNAQDQIFDWMKTNVGGGVSVFRGTPNL